MKTDSDSEHVMSKPPLSIAGGNQAYTSPSSNFASTSSQPVASSPTSNVNNSRNSPVRRKSTEIIASPPPKEEQIKAPALAKLNIKVRDFAFEDTLPPIAPFHRTLHPPLQVHAGPRPPKRPRQEQYSQDDDPFFDGLSQMVAGPIQLVASRSGRPEGEKPKPLERENTEPAGSNKPPLPSRERGYADLSQYQPASQSQPQPPANSSPRTPTRLAPIYTNSQSQNPWTPDYLSQSQPLPQFVFSQESEPYIDTPLVTPNGSLQWPVTDVDINSIPESQMDTESQVPAPEILTYSQLGFSPLQSQMDNPSQSQQESPPTALPAFQLQSSPLSAQPSSPLPLFSPSNASPGPSTEPSCPPPSSPSPQSRSPRRPKERSSPSGSVSPPRYNFRKRQAPSPLAPPGSPPPPPAQRTTRLRSRESQPSSSRPLQFSMQSAHARSKGQSSNGSLRPKTTRKPRSASGAKVDGRRYDDKMIMG